MDKVYYIQIRSSAPALTVLWSSEPKKLAFDENTPAIEIKIFTSRILNYFNI